MSFTKLLRFPRLISALIILLAFTPKVFAQWGSTYQFNFSLTDSTTGLSTLGQYEYLKSQTPKGLLKIVAHNATYTISAEQCNHVDFKDGIITINYFTLTQNSRVQLTIQRLFNKTETTFNVDIDKLKDNDYSAIAFSSKDLIADLSFGKNLQHFKYEVKNYKAKGRDVSCLVYETCTPKWNITPYGKEHYENQYKRVLNRKLAIYRKVADSLISTRFAEGVFEKLFELECQTGLYQKYYPPKCEIRSDTTIYAIKRTYRLKEPRKDTTFSLTINASSYPKQTYFLYPYFKEGALSEADFSFVSKQKVIALAKANNPHFKFQLDSAGQPIAHLIYLQKFPVGRMPFEQNLPIGQVNNEHKNWEGAFSYVFQADPNSEKETSDMTICHTSIYYYASRLALIARVTSCYNLMDE